MYFSKLTIRKFYVICEAFNKETEEVKTIKGEIGELFSDEEIQELQDTLSDMSSENYYNEQDYYGQISYALESVLNDGDEFKSVSIFRSQSDSYDKDPVYFAFSPYETTDDTKLSEQDNEKPRRLMGSNLERLKRLAKQKKDKDISLL